MRLGPSVHIPMLSLGPFSRLKNDVLEATRGSSPAALNPHNTLFLTLSEHKDSACC